MYDETKSYLLRQRATFLLCTFLRREVWSLWIKDPQNDNTKPQIFTIQSLLYTIFEYFKALGYQRIARRHIKRSNKSLEQKIEVFESKMQR